MKISLGFSRADTFISKIIRRFLASRVSHTYIRLYDEYLGVEFILHADKKTRIGFVDAKQFDCENVIVEEFEIDHPGIQASIQKNNYLLGREYDRGMLFGWAWTIAFKRWVNRKIKNPTEDPGKLICVDYAIKILNVAGITQLPYGLLNPQTLLEWCWQNHEQNGWLRNIREEQ